MAVSLNLFQTQEPSLQIGVAGAKLVQTNTNELTLTQADGVTLTKGYAETPVLADPNSTIATKGYVQDSANPTSISSVESGTLNAATPNASTATLAGGSPTFTPLPAGEGRARRVTVIVTTADVGATLAVSTSGFDSILSVPAGGILSAIGSYIVELPSIVLTGGGEFQFALGSAGACVCSVIVDYNREPVVCSPTV